MASQKLTDYTVTVRLTNVATVVADGASSAAGMASQKLADYNVTVKQIVKIEKKKFFSLQIEQSKASKAPSTSFKVEREHIFQVFAFGTACSRGKRG
jgi:hypothetical protein